MPLCLPLGALLRNGLLSKAMSTLFHKIALWYPQICLADLQVSGQYVFVISRIQMAITVSQP